MYHILWASLVTQAVNNLPAMQGTQIREDPLEKEMATYSSILPWRITSKNGQWRLVGYSPWGHKELDTAEWLAHTHHILCKSITTYLYANINYDSIYNYINKQHFSSAENLPIHQDQYCWEKYQQPQICRWYHSKGRKWRAKEPLDGGEKRE